MPFPRRRLLVTSAAVLPAAAVLTLTRPWSDDSEPIGSTLDGSAPAVPPSEPPDPQERRPRFVSSGHVVDVNGDEITLEDSDGNQRRVQVSDYEVDDGYWVKGLPIEPGDKVTTGSGKLWVNAKFYYGSVLEVIDAGPEPPVRFRIRDRYDLSPYHEQQPEGHIVLIDPRTLIAGPLPDPPPSVTPYRLPQDTAAERGVELAVGQYVEVVGREYRGELHAIRLML